MENDDEIGVLTFLQGEYNNYLGGYYVDEEKSDNVKRMLYLYRNQAETMWGEDAVNAVIAAYTNVCCIKSLVSPSVSKQQNRS